MRRFLYLFFSLFLLPCLATAQTTNVTLQVTDAGSQSWNNGVWNVVLVTPPGVIPFGPPYNIIGTATPVPNQSQSGSLNGTGSGSMTLTQNAGIAPSKSGWNFTVCSQATAINNCFTQFVVITATTAVTLTPPALTVNPGPLAVAYSDSELVNAVPGSTYYNVTTNSQRLCNGPAPCTWAASIGSSGLTDPGGNGVVIRAGLGTTTNRSIAATTPVTVSNADGTAGNPTLACVTCVTSAATLTNNQLVFGAGGQASAIGDLTGDATTGGGKVTTVVKINGTTVSTNAAGDQFLRTTASAVASWVSMTDCQDANGSHLNYTVSTHLLSCGSTFNPLIRSPFTGLSLVNGANQNIAVTNSSQYITGPTAAFSIGGIVAGSDGQFVYLYNTTSQTMTINNLDAGSSAANQIKTLTGTNVSVTGPGTVTLMYSATDATWHIHDPWPTPITIAGKQVQIQGVSGTGTSVTLATAVSPGVFVGGHGAVWDNSGNLADSGFPNVVNGTCSIVANCDQSGLTTGIGPLSITTSAAAGHYLYTASIDTASGSAGGTVSVVADWTDEFGSHTGSIIQPFVCGTNLATWGILPARIGGGTNIQFHTVVSSTGTCNYTISVSPLRLR